MPRGSDTSESRKTRCLQLIETGGPGGAENMLIDLASSLRKRDVDPLVILLKPGWLANKLREKEIETVVMPWNGTLDVKWLRSVCQMVRTTNVDVIHSHEFFMNVVASLVGLMTHTPVVTTVHGKNYYGERRRRRTMYRFVSFVTHMVAVSENIKVYLATIGVRESRCSVVENGIETQMFFPSSTARSETRLGLCIPPQNLCILSVGNLYPVKGHRYLLEAAPLIRKVFHDLTIVLAGRGEQQSQLEDIVDQLGISDVVKFLGFVDDVLPLYQACDVFVLPSLSEGLPLTVLEAMSCGCPVVATRVGGLGEIIDEGKSGLLVEPESPEAIASAVIRLAQDSTYKHQIASEGQDVVELRFSINRMSNRYRQIYDDLLRSP